MLAGRGVGRLETNAKPVVGAAVPFFVDSPFVARRLQKLLILKLKKKLYR